MTTVILTIIGILLAAASALMIMYYGATSFEGGNISARSSTLINAGENVQSAEQVYFNQYLEGSPNLQALLTSKYLANPPSVHEGTVSNTYQTVTDSNGKSRRAFVITDISEKVCLSVERKMRESQITTLPTTADYLMGCIDNGGTRTYYAKLI